MSLELHSASSRTLAKAPCCYFSSSLARLSTFRAYQLSVDSLNKRLNELMRKTADPLIARHRHASIASMGIRDKPIAPASPWQNGFAEPLIGPIRRKCLDHIVVFPKAHLLRILRYYAHYYNDVRTHRSLDTDAPIARPVQRIGSITLFPILGGLHHRYARV
jgi:transposase InsO family protein